MNRKITALLIGSLVAGLTACGGGGKTESVADSVTESHVEENASSSETANTNTADDTQFFGHVEDGIFCIEDVDSDAEEIIVPDTIAEVPVGKIKKMAFYDLPCKKITLPDSVTRIGRTAFMNCDKLEAIELGSGLTYIGAMAFQGCKALETVTFPDSLVTIKGTLFFGCDLLKEVYVPASATEIEDGLASAETCPNLVIVTPEGSRAGAVAEEQNVPVRYVEADPAQSVPDTVNQEDESKTDDPLADRTLDDIWTTYILRGEVKKRRTYEPPVKFAFMDLDWDNMPVKDTPPVFYPEEFESGLVMPFINNDLTKFDFSASSAGRVTGAELDSDDTLFDSSLWVTAVKTGPEMADQYFRLTSRLDRPATVKEILESNNYTLEPLNYAYYAFGLPLPEGMSRKSIDHFKEIVDHLGRPDAILIEKTTQSIDPEGQMDAELFWIYDDFAIHIYVHDGRQKDADDYFDFTVTIIAKEAINSYAEKVCDRDDLYRCW